MFEKGEAAVSAVDPQLRDYLASLFTLGPRSAHFKDHWGRVEQYGLYLARSSGADPKVVSLFAWFHDCQRQNEGHDPEHGPRAAELARRLWGSHFQLEEAQLRLLVEACHDHDRGRTHLDPTIGTCWDADRLDLDRVCIAPQESYLSTAEARVLAQLRPLDRQEKVGILKRWRV